MNVKTASVKARGLAGSGFVLCLWTLSILAPRLQAQSSDGISRELTIFNDLTNPVARKDTASRELTVFSDVSGPLAIKDAFSPELTGFNDVVNPVAVTDAVSREFSLFPVTPLQLGVPFPSALASRQQAYFKLEVPADLTIRVRLDHTSPSAWVALYASFGVAPELDDAQFVSETTSAPNARLTIPTTRQGTYYILIICSNGATPPESMDVMVLAESIPFRIEQIVPPVVGAGEVTIRVNGGRLDSSTIFTLSNPVTHQEISPTAVTVHDAAHAGVRFNLSAAPVGIYEAIARSAGAGAESHLDAALTVEQAQPLSMDTQVSGFPVKRRGFPREGLITMVNTGNVDVPYSELFFGITNAPGISLTFTLQTLYDRKDVALSVDPELNEEVVSRSLLLGRIPVGRFVDVPCTLHVTGEYPDETSVLFADCQPMLKSDFIEHVYLGDIYRILLGVRNDPSLPVVTDEEFQAASAEIFQVARDYPPEYDQTGLMASAVQPTASRLAEQVDGTDLCYLWDYSCLVCAPLVPTGYPAAVCGAACLLGGHCCEDPCRPLCPTRGAPECAPECLPTTKIGKAGTGRCAVITVCTQQPKFTILGLGGLWNCVWECSSSNPTCIRNPRSFDPNQKNGPPGFGQDSFVSNRDALSYQVQFENLPSASAPAADVLVIDALDPSLDAASFQVGAIHFGNTTLSVPVGRTSYRATVDLTSTHGVIVDVEAGIDVDRLEAFWIFRSLDPKTGLIPEDPFLGFLPPNDASGRGEGWVEYSIRPKSLSPTGSIITNQASIVFDFNDPIITNQVSNTLDSGSPSSSVSGLPNETSSPFTLTWSGLDDAGGCGIAYYRIYVSEDDGPFGVWREGPEVSGEFAGEHGKTYQFYSVAVDNVGNSEAVPAVADASTKVVIPLQLVSAVSYKTHGQAGAFDIDLPLAPGTLAGVECRSGGPTQVVLTFTEAVAVGGSASIGSLSDGPAANQKTITLGGVADGTCAVITLDGIRAVAGNELTGNTQIRVAALLGDTNASGSVSGADVAQTKSFSGQVVDQSNFRCDTNLSGSISGADVGQVSSRSGNTANCP